MKTDRFERLTEAQTVCSVVDPLDTFCAERRGLLRCHYLVPAYTPMMLCTEIFGLIALLERFAHRVDPRKVLQAASEITMHACHVGIGLSF